MLATSDVNEPPFGARVMQQQPSGPIDTRQLDTGMRQQRGQTSVEYVVVLTVITVAAVAAFALLASTSTSVISRIIGFL